jgi:hypothetical protein
MSLLGLAFTLYRLGSGVFLPPHGNAGTSMKALSLVMTEGFTTTFLFIFLSSKVGKKT